jgi:hypothetical protein
METNETSKGKYSKKKINFFFYKNEETKSRVKNKKK